VQRHIAECEECAKHDAIVRRSLLLFRNLPRIEPSADFSEKLNVRIRELKSAEAAPVFHHSRVFAATIAVSSALMLGYIGSSLRDVDASRDIVFPPVVASIPEPEVAPITTPGAGTGRFCTGWPPDLDCRALCRAGTNSLRVRPTSSSHVPDGKSPGPKARGFCFRAPERPALREFRMNLFLY
jgi:anti-sigma factor RsiW